VIPVSLATVQFSRSAKRRAPRRSAHREGEPPAGRRSLKAQQHAGRLAETDVSSCGLPGPVDISSGRTRPRRAPRGSKSAGGDPAGVRCPEGLPRKEVIQPQLPLRLPCYDFTPVASPTFDGSLPNGLGHRLRVLLTPMV
jgi:hypothetical protein